MRRRPHRGAILVLAAIALVGMLAIVALAIDIGYMGKVKVDLQAAADSAALAGAATPGSGHALAMKEARKFAQLNLDANSPGKGSQHKDQVLVETGRWDAVNRRFEINGAPEDAVRVVARRTRASLFFGSVLGQDKFNLEASAVARYRPRDIMLVLDYSGSMNMDDNIEGLKDTVSLFLKFLSEAQGGDRVGFAGYATTGSLDQSLTDSLDKVKKAVNARAADGYTNMGEGMMLAREDLREHGRPNALQLMILMTDGIANRPYNRHPKSYVRDEAKLAAQQGIPIVAISFGKGADKRTMKEAARISGGVHYHVVGNPKKQEEKLRDVFLEVAAWRPPQLVD
jgi:Mg-chelatase subunit ChlD